MAERRRRSVYRTRAAEDEVPDDHSTSKIEAISSPGSGFKRPRNSLKRDGDIAENEVVKDERVRKVRHTMAGSEKVNSISDHDGGIQQNSRPSKLRQTVDFSHSTHRGEADSTKSENKSSSRKSSSRKSASSSQRSEDNISPKISGKGSKSRTADAVRQEPDPKSAGKGKSKTTDRTNSEPSQISSKNMRTTSAPEADSKGKGKAKPSAIPDYDSVADFSRLHEEVPTDMPEPRRLQRLLELAIEAEQAQMSRLYTADCAWISR